MLKNKKSSTGFTIVELLVVIIVIGILASILYLSYRGISLKATEASLQADLSNAATQLKAHQATNGVYPTTIDCAQADSATNKCIKASNGATYGNYSADNASKPQTFTLEETKDDVTYVVTSDAAPTKKVAAASTSFIVSYNALYGEEGYDATVLSDGSYAITGATYNASDTVHDVFVAKYTSTGTLAWSRQFGEADPDQGVGLAATNDGGFVVTGQMSNKMFLARFASTGAMSWLKTWGNGSFDEGRSVAVTSDNGYIVTGGTGSYKTGSFMTDMFIAKYASDGTLSWTKTWGGTYEDIGESIIVNSDNYVVTGHTSSWGATSSDDDLFVAKYDLAGNLLWNKIIASSGGYDDFGYSVSASTSNTYLVSGKYNGKAIIAKFASDGTLSWAKDLSLSTGESIVATGDGGFITPGDDGGLDKFSSSNALSWGVDLDATELSADAYAVGITSDGGYFSAGYISVDGGNSYDAYIAKYNSDGSITNCPATMCFTSSPASNNLTITPSTPAATTASPSAANASSAVTATDPSGTTTVIAAP